MSICKIPPVYQMVEIMATLYMRKMMSKWMIWALSTMQRAIVSKAFALLGAHSFHRPPPASCSALLYSITIVLVPWK